MAVVAPSRDSVISGIVAPRKAKTYQRLRPTLSISSAQMIAAARPANEAVKP
jgi:hypothetical protein